MQKLNLSNYARMTLTQINKDDLIVTGLLDKHVKLELSRLKIFAGLSGAMDVYRDTNEHNLAVANGIALKALKKISLTDKE